MVSKTIDYDITVRGITNNQEELKEQIDAFLLEVIGTEHIQLYRSKMRCIPLNRIMTTNKIMIAESKINECNGIYVK